MRLRWQVSLGCIPHQRLCHQLPWIPLVRGNGYCYPLSNGEVATAKSAVVNVDSPPVLSVDEAEAFEIPICHGSPQHFLTWPSRRLHRRCHYVVGHWQLCLHYGRGTNCCLCGAGILEATTSATTGSSSSPATAPTAMHIAEHYRYRPFAGVSAIWLGLYTKPLPNVHIATAERGVVNVDAPAVVHGQKAIATLSPPLNY
mmetsp:Transcript_26032/g.50967  ORF Transcript_26032/g.50967 Transcript_26032/m.50967 type:complete len:200 (-) Transcript_26032:167-766(-)